MSLEHAQNNCVKKLNKSFMDIVLVGSGSDMGEINTSSQGNRFYLLIHETQHNNIHDSWVTA